MAVTTKYILVILVIILILIGVLFIDDFSKALESAGKEMAKSINELIDWDLGWD